MTKRTTCLTNQWVLVGMAGVIEACAKPSSDAKQIGDAVYDPDAERLQVTFKDRTTLVVSTRQ